MLRRLFDILNYSLLKKITVSWVSSSCASSSSSPPPQQPQTTQQPVRRAHQAACICGLLWSQQRGFTDSVLTHAAWMSVPLRCVYRATTHMEQCCT